MEAIVEAMKMHPKHKFVQVHACEALGNLAVVVENRAAIAAAGGIEAVVAALAAHVQSKYVAEPGLRALQNLSLDDGSQAQLTAAGSARAVVSAMDAHRAEKTVQESGCRALCNLSYHNGEGDVASTGGIDAILRAMRIHQGVARVQQNACKALRNLCATESNRVRVLMGGGVDDLIQALTTHTSSSAGEVRQQACAVLGDLAISAECHGSMLQQGSVEAVVFAVSQAARTEDSIERLLELATTLFSRLSVHTDALRRMRASGAADLLSRVVTRAAGGSLPVSQVSQAAYAMGLEILAKLRDMEASIGGVASSGVASGLLRNVSIQDHCSRPPDPLPPSTGSALVGSHVSIQARPPPLPLPLPPPALAGSPMVRVEGMLLYSAAFPQGVLWSGFNGVFVRQDRLCNQQCVFQKVDGNGMWGNAAMWWGNNSGLPCWVIGPADAGASAPSLSCARLRCPLGACLGVSMV